jgi:hypothetical protein
MGTNYPTALDNITRPSAGQTLAAGQHSQRHDDESDAIEALEAKVGVNGSTDAASIDKRVSVLEGSIGFSGLASAVVVTPTGNIAATNAQTALAELDTEKVAYAQTTTASMSFVVDEDTMVSDLATKVPTQQSTKAYVDTHIAATPGAHAATAVSYDHSASGLAAVDVQAAVDELQVALTGGGIPATLIDAAWDLIVGTADNTAGRLAKGADGTVLGVSGGALSYLDPRRIPMTVNAQVGTTYTFALTDTWVTLNNAAAVTATVPTNASVAYPVGSVVNLGALGAGQVTVAPAGGVTLRTSSTLKLRTQYSGATLIKLGTDEWLLVGDLEPLGQVINAQVGTTYGFLITDAWKMVTLTNASPITATLPSNASVPYPVGTHIDAAQYGAGQVTFAITTDTLHGTPTVKTRAQYSPVTLIKVATTEWLLAGDLSP